MNVANGGHTMTVRRIHLGVSIKYMRFVFPYDGGGKKE